jgi:hypothetical protein
MARSAAEALPRGRRHWRGLCLAALLASGALFANPHAAADEKAPSAWSVLEQRHPERAAAVPEEERRVLHLLDWEQLLAWVDGLDPSLIVLADGRTLASLLGVGFDLSWWTIDGGGGTASGGGFALAGTVGQPDAGAMSGGAYTLGGGFWPVDPRAIFSDGFEGGSASRWSAVTGVSP